MNKILNVTAMLIALGIFSIFGYATCVSLLSNPSLKWYDIISAGPFLYIFLSLAYFKDDSALVHELNGWLNLVKRWLGLN